MEEIPNNEYFNNEKEELLFNQYLMENKLDKINNTNWHLEKLNIHKLFYSLDEINFPDSLVILRIHQYLTLVYLTINITRC